MPTAAGPRGLARWRKDSPSAMLVVKMVVVLDILRKVNLRCRLEIPCVADKIRFDPRLREPLLKITVSTLQYCN